MSVSQMTTEMFRLSYLQSPGNGMSVSQMTMDMFRLSYLQSRLCYPFHYFSPDSTRVTPRVTLVEQGLLSLPEQLI